MTTPLRTRVAAAAGTGLLSLALAACGTTPQRPVDTADLTTPSPPPVPTAPARATSHALTFPTDAYRLSARQDHTVLVATDTLLTACMRGFGFTTFTRSAGPMVSDAFGTDRLYGVSDPAVAARYGYRLTTSQEAAVKQGQAQVTAEHRAAALSATEASVLGGPTVPAKAIPARYHGKTVPAGGCYGAADRRLGIDPRVDTSLPQVLNNTAYAQAEADARVKARLARWSACMAAKGYRARDPLSLSDRWNEHSASVSPAEIRSAVTDVACKQRTGLVSTWYAVQTAYDKALIHQNQRLLDKVRRQLTTESRKAALVS